MFAETAERTHRASPGRWKAGSPLVEQWESTFHLQAAPLKGRPMDRIESADLPGRFRHPERLDPAISPPDGG